MFTSATQTTPPPLYPLSLYAQEAAKDPNCSPALVRSPQESPIQCTAAPQWRRATESPAGSTATPPTPVWFQPSPEVGVSIPQTAPNVTTAWKEVSRQKRDISGFTCGQSAAVCKGEVIRMLRYLWGKRAGQCPSSLRFEQIKILCMLLLQSEVEQWCNEGELAEIFSLRKFEK